jgi:hypothetical protein
MTSLNPIALLERELVENEKALQKSIDLYQKGKIDAETHLTHKINLRKLIDNYTYAIYLLKK